MTIHMAPFFAALQDLILDGDPRPQRKPSCRWCGDTRERGEGGGGCSWCSADDTPATAGPARGSVEQFDRTMAAYRARAAETDTQED